MCQYNILYCLLFAAFLTHVNKYRMALSSGVDESFAFMGEASVEIV